MGNYEHFDQLMLADNSGLTVEQQQFKDLHERICYNARKSAEHWVEMASAIREMRDSKRYRAAGFEDFADYTVNALGIKERQAYNYISVIEKLPEEFIRAHATIGVTKLALLTSVNEEEREEILEKIDLDTARTSEINAAVKAAIEERDKANQHSPVIEMVYLTTQPKNSLPTHVDITSAERPSIALCEQIHSVSKNRVGGFISKCTDKEMAMIDGALCVSLGIELQATPEPQKVIPPPRNLRTTARNRHYGAMWNFGKVYTTACLIS